MSTSYKRPRLDDPPQYSYDDFDDDNDTSTPYVSVIQRREAEKERLAGRNSFTSSRAKQVESKKRQEEEDALREKERIAKEKELSKTLLVTAQEVKKQKEEADAQKTADQLRAEQEAETLKMVSNKRKLASDFELAKGIQYREPLKTTWTPPRHIRQRTVAENRKVREKNHILVETMVNEQEEDIPPPIASFRQMKVIKPILSYLKSKNISKPSPIQCQGLPVAFSGRDMIGVAFTGSGKTLAFSLPLLMFALEEQTKMAFQSGEGPVGMIVCPSRELARQTYEGLVQMSKACSEAGYPDVGILLAIGGINMHEQKHTLSRGFHIVVATPGRLQDMLEKRKFSLDNCRYLVLDEADRMIDMGFEDDVRNIMSYFKYQRQTLLFSATMPAKIRDFATSSLIKPIVVNVGRAGAASLDVIQEVEYVQQEAKMVYLLECLQKTPPPVIIFSDNKNEVDGKPLCSVCWNVSSEWLADIQEYLLTKGVEAVAIHGSKTQEEREYAIRSFKEGKKDVMVASGVASKVDFKLQRVEIGMLMDG